MQTLYLGLVHLLLFTSVQSDVNVWPPFCDLGFLPTSAYVHTVAASFLTLPNPSTSTKGGGGNI